MKLPYKLLFLFSSATFLLGSPAYAEDKKVKMELADMIEAVVKETG